MRMCSPGPLHPLRQEEKLEVVKGREMHSSSFSPILAGVKIGQR